MPMGKMNVEILAMGDGTNDRRSSVCGAVLVGCLGARKMGLWRRVLAWVGWDRLLQARYAAKRRRRYERVHGAYRMDASKGRPK